MGEFSPSVLILGSSSASRAPIDGVRISSSACIVHEQCADLGVRSAPASITAVAFSRRSVGDLA